jgi:hypothetical protein
VRVHDTQALNSVPWQAASNRSWLAVTPSGTTGQDVTLTADPTALAQGQYEGEVTLSTTDAFTTGTQTIRVGLTVRSADPPASVTLPVTNSARTRTNPVDPEFYSAEGNFIRSYDVYSGALLRTIADLGEEPYALAVSDDGRVVYALLDAKTTESRVIAIRPGDGTVLNTLLLPYNGFTSSNEANLAYVRPDGRPFVISTIAGGL